MKKHDVNLQDSIIMIFSRLYENELKKTQKMKQECNLDKKMSENMLKKLNQQKKKSLKNNFINVKIDRMLSLIVKQVVKKKIRINQRKMKRINKMQKKLNKVRLIILLQNSN